MHHRMWMGLTRERREERKRGEEEKRGERRGREKKEKGFSGIRKGFLGEERGGREKGGGGGEGRRRGREEGGKGRGRRERGETEGKIRGGSVGSVGSVGGGGKEKVPLKWEGKREKGAERIRKSGYRYRWCNGVRESQ